MAGLPWVDGVVDALPRRPPCIWPHRTTTAATPTDAPSHVTCPRCTLRAPPPDRIKLIQRRSRAARSRKPRCEILAPAPDPPAHTPAPTTPTRSHGPSPTANTCFAVRLWSVSVRVEANARPPAGGRPRQIRSHGTFGLFHRRSRGIFGQIRCPPQISPLPSSYPHLPPPYPSAW